MNDSLRIVFGNCKRMAISDSFWYSGVFHVRNTIRNSVWNSVWMPTEVVVGTNTRNPIRFSVLEIVERYNNE